MMKTMVKVMWLVVFRPTPLKNHGVKVSWDDDIPNIWKVIKMFETTNQYKFAQPPLLWVISSFC